MRTLLVGNCSGFYGDRHSAMREMLEGGPLDYLTGDYLAELTMLILGRDRLKDPALGYARTFLRQLTDCLALAHERGVRIVANAGGLNPAGLAQALRAVAADQGVPVAVAHVEGDDLLDRGWPGALTANAYLGAFGIAHALRAGAQIVVTGRVTDAALTLGPAIAEFGWGREDFDLLAAGVVVGHVLECGTQATGGNFSGFSTVDTSRPLGFPLAQISADGTAVISKHPGTGGAVTVDTVTAQLVYEVGGPRYLNPDVTTRLDTVALEQVGTDRVRLSGVRGEPPPGTTKVALTTIGGHRNSVEFVLTGLDIEEKAAWVRAQLLRSLDASAPREIVWELVRTDRPDPGTEPEAAALLRCHVKDPDPAVVGRAFTSAAVELALASYPGFHVTAPPGAGSPFGVYRAEYVPQAQAPHVVVLPDGDRVEIPAPTVTASSTVDGATPPMPAWDGSGATIEVPLGQLVHARSGDKGGCANVGVWVPAGHPRRDEAFAWLAGFLDADRVRRLLPEAAALDVSVHPLPNLSAVNVVIDGLLGEGVAASTRFDPQAKAVGEWLRARVVPIPKELLTVTLPTQRPARMTLLDDLLHDLAQEGDRLRAAVADLPEEAWRTPTPAQGWDIATQIAHLASTDEALLHSAAAIRGDKDGWDAVVLRAIADPAGFVDTEARAGAGEPPARILARWDAARAAVPAALRGADGKLPWFGPPMSPTSMATARIMETWAHGLDVYGALGLRPAITDAIYHICYLGIRTRAFAFTTHELEPPTEEFRVELTAPSGTTWEWGPADASQRVTGPAEDFARLVTQRVHRDDTALTAVGADADRWLSIAQAFAGPPGTGRGSDS